MADLKTVLQDYLPSCSSVPHYDDLLKEIKTALENLLEAGAIALGEDKDLTGTALEIRTRLLFEKLGFDIVRGRPHLEDFIVRPLSGAEFQDPLVLEVKSSKKPNVSRDDLRQLDDWVFDLSGEQKARKEGLGGEADAVAIFTSGYFTSKKRHPTPHKGVMIFNGLAGKDFSERNRITYFDENDREFIEKRNFCIISLEVLIDYEKAFEKDKEMRVVFWERIHQTVGMLDSPE